MSDEWFRSMKYEAILHALMKQGHRTKVVFENRDECVGDIWRFELHIENSTTEKIEETEDVLALYDAVRKVGTGLWAFMKARYQTPNLEDTLFEAANYEKAAEIRAALKMDVEPIEFGWSGVTTTLYLLIGEVVLPGFKTDPMDPCIQDSWFVNAHLKFVTDSESKTYSPAIFSMRYDIATPSEKDKHKMAREKEKLRKRKTLAK